MFLENEKITFIRPFIYIDEKEIIRLVKEKNIPTFSSHCPNDKKTKREDIKNLISSLNSDYPSSYDNFLTMLNNQDKMDIFFLHEQHKVNDSNLYFKKIVDFCRVLDEKQYIKVPDSISKKSTQYHLYKDNQLIGILLLSKNERIFKLESVYLEKDKYFIPFVFTLYREISQKVNPISFIYNGHKYKNEAKKMKFANKKGSLVLEMNPDNLDAYLKKNKFI